MDASDIVPAMNALVADFKRRGVRASLDRRNLNLPAALITLDAIDHPTLHADPIPTVAVELLASDSGMPTSLNQLTGMLAKLAGLPGMGHLEKTLTQGGDVLGLRFTLELSKGSS